MGKRIQLWITLIILTVAAKAQCNDSIRVIEDTTCQYVIMTTDKFTEFYVAKNNLDILSNEIPKVKRTLDSLNKVNKDLYNNYEEQLKILNEEKELLVQSYDECSATLINSELENIKLKEEKDKLRKQRFTFFGAGVGSGGLVVLLIILL